MKVLLLFPLLFTFAGFSQNFNYSGSLGEFSSASAISISSLGFIYIADSGTDEVFKLDTLGNLVKDVGGYGWSVSQFDEPSDVFAAPLNIYVADKNNSRIQIFDKDLNYISVVSTRDGDNQEAAFGYPLSCAVSNQGDLFILDSENNRIIKFDVLGRFNQNFGGFDAGVYTLIKPVKLAVAGNGSVFILDDNKLLKIFDAFGNGIIIVKLETEFNDIDIMFNNVTLTANDYVLLAKTGSERLEFKRVELKGDFPKSDFVSSVFYNNRLYILTSTFLMVFVQE